MLTTEVSPENRKSCIVCGEPLTGRQRTCCSNKCHQDAHRKRNKVELASGIPGLIRISRSARELAKLAIAFGEMRKLEEKKKENERSFGRPPEPLPITVEPNVPRELQRTVPPEMPGPWGARITMEPSQRLISTRECSRKEIQVSSQHLVERAWAEGGKIWRTATDRRRSSNGCTRATLARQRN
jgi:predicted nucleic acid-binding Zn ribbon protein